MDYAKAIEEEARSRRQKYRRWYERNCNEFNFQRRARYTKDEAYRQRCLLDAKMYRKNGPKKGKKTDIVYWRTKGEKYFYPIHSVAMLVGRQNRTIKLWEKRGFYPKMKKAYAHRFYSNDQVELLKLIAKTIDTYRFNHAKLKQELAKTTALVRAKWGTYGY